MKLHKYYTFLRKFLLEYDYEYCHNLPQLESNSDVVLTDIDCHFVTSLNDITVRL